MTEPAPARARPVAPRRGRLTPLTLTDVRIEGGFWAVRQELNSRVTIEHCADWLERLGWIGNFDLTAGGDPAPRAGREFADSETYKLLEAMAWEIGRTGSATLESLYASVAARVIAAQREDGYLSTVFGGPGQPARWSDLEWGHELYCAGHLMQAAVARLRTHGEDELVRAARRFADLICDTFGSGGIERVCGHPEVELGLLELGRATGEPRYTEMARVFLARRGTGTLGEIELGAAYFQDDVPIREATVLRGHAVRALYLTAAAVDAAVDEADEQTLSQLETQWAHTVHRRTYLTGGMGSRHEGEAFGEDFELPSDRAYCETCAGVASVMLSWRLLLATGDERYADLAERTLFNVVAAGPHSNGAAFFYTNPLQQRTPGEAVAPDALNPRAAAGQRAPWFAVSCCPTNVARTFASLGAYVAMVDADGVQVHQYADATIRAVLPDGRSVALRMRTGYPDDGRVQLTVLETDAGPWTLSLRVPAWAAGGATLDGTPVPDGQRVVRVRRAFDVGDVLVLQLPVQPRWTRPDPRIDALRGQVAIEAGPLVLCAESIDIPDVELDDIRVDPAQGLQRGADGRPVASATVVRAPDGWPYNERPAHERGIDVAVPLQPYHLWAERGPSAMRVWLPTLA